MPPNLKDEDEVNREFCIHSSNDESFTIHCIYNCNCALSESDKLSPPPTPYTQSSRRSSRGNCPHCHLVPLSLSLSIPYHQPIREQAILSDPSICQLDNDKHNETAAAAATAEEEREYDGGW
nr:hypothetical protein HmN_000097700 [Hymenolepis microstoma]